MVCELCEREKRVIGHHLSYDPEIVVFICWSCHSWLHKFGRFNSQLREKGLGWLRDYADNWKNGHEKYVKTKRCRELMAKRHRVNYAKNPEQAKKSSKKWVENNREIMNAKLRRYYYRRKHNIPGQISMELGL